jgi:hypothetical protein
MEQAIEGGEVVEALFLKDGLQVELDVCLAADQGGIAEQAEGEAVGDDTPNVLSAIQVFLHQGVGGHARASAGGHAAEFLAGTDDVNRRERRVSPLRVFPHVGLKHEQAEKVGRHLGLDREPANLERNGLANAPVGFSEGFGAGLEGLPKGGVEFFVTDKSGRGQLPFFLVADIGVSMGLFQQVKDLGFVEPSGVVRRTGVANNLDFLGQ